MFRKMIIFMALATLIGLTTQAAADIWEPRYYDPDPTTTPFDWPVFKDPIPLGAGESIYIGAENLFIAELIKKGDFSVTYTGGWNFYPVDSKAGQTRDDGPYSLVSYTFYPAPSPDVHSLTVSFTITPQPEWEWFKFTNNDTATITITGISFFKTNCVPVPPTLWLFGSGLVVAGLIRRRKRLKV